MVNGASSNNKKWISLIKTLDDIAKPGVADILKAINVDYIIIHLDRYEEGPIPYGIKKYFQSSTSRMKYNDGFTPAIPKSFIIYKEFGNDLVLTIK